MTDRTPLSEVQDKVEPTNEAVWNKVGSTLVEETIEDTRNYRELSLMFGFDGDDFGGDFDKAMAIFEWAKSLADSDADALLNVKQALKTMGTNERGKTLLNKVYVWTSLENSIGDMRKRQQALSLDSNDEE